MSHIKLLCTFYCAWGPPALHILDFTAALSSQATSESKARIKRRSIQVISRTISQMNASLIRARQPLPFSNLVQYGPSHADSLSLALR
jgi:hypothetical protein